MCHSAHGQIAKTFKEELGYENHTGGAACSELLLIWTGRTPMNSAKFPLGQLVATPGALSALAKVGQSPQEFVDRHARGDWGELSDEDRQENERSITESLRILSAYRLRDGIRIWIITEADRSSTCILLPDEY